MKLEPVAWIDEFGNTFPLAAYNGGKAWRDSHKHNWKPLYAIPEGYVVVPVSKLGALELENKMLEAANEAAGKIESLFQFKREAVEYMKERLGIRGTIRRVKVEFPS